MSRETVLCIIRGLLAGIVFGFASFGLVFSYVEFALEVFVMLIIFSGLIAGSALIGALFSNVFLGSLYGFAIGIGFAVFIPPSSIAHDWTVLAYVPLVIIACIAAGAVASFRHTTE